MFSEYVIADISNLKLQDVSFANYNACKTEENPKKDREAVVLFFFVSFFVFFFYGANIFFSGNDKSEYLSSTIHFLITSKEQSKFASFDFRYAIFEIYPFRDGSPYKCRMYMSEIIQPCKFYMRDKVKLHLGYKPFCTDLFRPFDN